MFFGIHTLIIYNPCTIGHIFESLLLVFSLVKTTILTPCFQNVNDKNDENLLIHVDRNFQEGGRNPPNS